MLPPRNVPAEGEAFFTFSTAARYTSTDGRAVRGCSSASPSSARITGTARGEVDDRRRRRPLPRRAGRDRRTPRAASSSSPSTSARSAARCSEAVQVAAGVVARRAADRLGARLGHRRPRARAAAHAARRPPQAITETDFTRRIEVDGDDEIAELGRTFNAMLDRLERAFASQRAFVSDAGHELRTPITIVRGHLELLGDDPAGARGDGRARDRRARPHGPLRRRPAAARQGRAGATSCAPGRSTSTSSPRSSSRRRRRSPTRDWRLAARGAGAAHRRPPAAHPGASMQLAQNAVQHTEPGDRDRARLGAARRATPGCGSPTAGPASRPASSDADLRPLPPRRRRAPPLRRRRARPVDRPRHRRGPRRPRRARQRRRPGRRTTSP